MTLWIVQDYGAEANSIISNMRNNISYKIRARLYAWGKKGRPTRKRWCCFRLMVFVD
jgi:hypothetical protein